MSQSWCDLAFLHWFVPPSEVASYMPVGAVPDVLPHGRFRGLTPVGLVPFRMVGAGLGSGPAVPYFGTFWETNVRLYSTDAEGGQGVVFRSLDASRLAVVVGAKLLLGLPYRFARMRGYERRAAGFRELAWTTRSRWPGPAGVRSRIAIRVGAVTHDFRDGPAAKTRRGDGETAGAAVPSATAADPSAGAADPSAGAADPSAGAAKSSAVATGDAELAAFLTARWGLHTTAFGRPLFIPNEHQPWTLRSAEVLVLDDELLAAAGFPGLAGRRPDHVCFAEGVRAGFGMPRLR